MKGLTSTKVRQRASSSCKRAATRGGTRSSIRPPNVASSLTPLEDRKLYCGEAIRYTDSTSGSCRRLSWFISSSYSKSEIARSPFTIAFAPTCRANSTTSVLNGSARTPSRSAIACSMKPIRSSIPNSALLFLTERLTTPTTTSSYSAAPQCKRQHPPPPAPAAPARRGRDHPRKSQPPPPPQGVPPPIWGVDQHQI